MTGQPDSRSPEELEADFWAAVTLYIAGLMLADVIRHPAATETITSTIARREGTGNDGEHD